MSRAPTIQAKAVEKIARAAAIRGVTAQSLYQAVGLNAAVLDNPDARISFAHVVSLYEQAALLTGDEAFGLHVGEQVDPKAFDVLGYAVINSPTFGEALDRVVRYNFTWTNGSYFTVEKTDPEARITYTYPDDSPAERRHDAEMTMAAVAVLGRRCLVRFGAKANELRFDSSHLRLPIVKADPGLCAVLDRHAEELLTKYPREDTLIERSRTIIRKELNGGDASLERVAEQLGMSARTLQRKLRHHGTSHQQLL